MYLKHLYEDLRLYALVRREEDQYIVSNLATFCLVRVFAMSQMKTVKTETDLQSSMESRLQRVLRKSSELVAKTRSRAAEVVELGTVKVAAAKVRAVESVSSVKQRVMEKVSQTADG